MQVFRFSIMKRLALALLPMTAVLAQDLTWEELPAIPDKEGFAGMYAGVSGGALLAAGGANFPDKKPWEGGTKAWYDTVFALEKPKGEWRAVGKLPSARGYGVSITLDDGLLCIGGANTEHHFADCFVLQWDGHALQTKPLPALPKPMANLCGARVGEVIYLAGGIATPTATSTLSSFLALDLKRLDRGWQSLTTWPGRPRMLATAASCAGSFFLVGGTDLQAGPDGKPLRTYLTDGYQFTPGTGWKKIADLPQSSVAAPSPALADEHGFVVLSGDDGALVNFEPKTKHPGFPHVAFAYDVKTGAWTQIADMPVANVTNPTTQWLGSTVIVSGEARPGVRSPAVWSVQRKNAAP